ncbi:MAG: glycosyltransferase [Bacteroidetes bacterium]|nr:glycosyltransferase [Bacteroidota bacterium]
MDKQLHIVTHDVPWPVDFGGVVDLFYKIKALHGYGIKIHLHCFTAGKPRQKVLEKYCEAVHYYHRKTGLKGIAYGIPYIVQSRSDSRLLENLNKDNYPVLLEGIHCTYFLQQNKLQHRKVFVRLHNVEFKYYHQLAVHETNLLRKFYFKRESRLLKKYEAQLAAKAKFLAVSKEDEACYKNELQAKDVQFLPVFLPWDESDCKTGRGEYCLYHGNLSINENENAVHWLLTEVFNQSAVPLIIAGKDPSPALTAVIAKARNAKLIANPSEAVIQQLIREAHINVLPSFNITGVKLKLLNALFNGRHCLVNNKAAEGSEVEQLCTIAETSAEWKHAITNLFNEAFTEEKIRQRITGLKEIYNTDKNTQKLIAWIY